MSEIEEFLKNNPVNPEFTPYAFYNKDGDQLEIYWENSMDYSKPINGMCLHIDQETERTVGATVYSLKKILDKAGLKIVPKNEL